MKAVLYCSHNISQACNYLYQVHICRVCGANTPLTCVKYMQMYEDDLYHSAAESIDTEPDDDAVGVDGHDVTDPDFEMNETLGEPEFGKANMRHHLW